jgi:trk system potassium uptake protein TrkH
MSHEAERALRHAVRPRVVVRYLGELGLVLGAMTAVPVLGAALLGEFRLMVPYALTGGLLLALGAWARRTPTAAAPQRNEAVVVVAAAFLLSSLVLSGPLVALGLPWPDALFEAVSGVTTTGLSTLGSVQAHPRTFLLARAWMQWAGGIGFVVLSLALTLGPGVAARRLGAPLLEPGDAATSMRERARRLLLVYLALTGFGVLALLFLGAGVFDAVLHTLAGVSTGGFAPRDASLAPLARRLQCGVLGISALGAVSLPVYFHLRQGRWRTLRDDVEVRALLLAIVVVAALVLAAAALGGAAGGSSGDLALLAVSAQTTTGFATFAIEGLPDAAKAVLVVSMLTGGSLGSTAGGMKLLRVLLIARLLQWLFMQTRLPAHALSAPTLAGERLDASEILQAAAVILLFAVVLVASWIPFLVYGYAPMDALFEVASATGTVGLSVGIARPELEPVLRGVLCMDMLLGRLEVFALLVAVSPRTWIGRRQA